MIIKNGDSATTINKLKEQPGKGLLVYDGAQFVGAFNGLNLIEKTTRINSPIAIGKGMRIFKSRKPLKLERSIAYGNGENLNKYVPGSPVA